MLKKQRVNWKYLLKGKKKPIENWKQNKKIIASFTFEKINQRTLK